MEAMAFGVNSPQTGWLVVWLWTKYLTSLYLNISSSSVGTNIFIFSIFKEGLKAPDDKCWVKWGIT